MKGKCKYCKAPIGIQYPFFEFVTGCLTALLSALIVDTPTLVIALLLLYNGLVIAAIDFKYQIIPNRNNLFFLLIGIGLSAYCIYLGQFDLLIDGGFGFLIAFSTMFLLVMLNVWGAGDLKMMSAVGLILGFKLTLLTIWLGILLGAVMGLFLICIKNKSRKDKMAFGPALVAGMMISYVFGTDLINSYIGYFL
jgi:prepilin signal peptidase PulO-like enzyme (type II secretory pathway)